MKKFVFLWIFLLVASTAFPSADFFVPAFGKTLLFIGQDRNTIAHYVQKTGHVPDGTMLYTSIQELKGVTFPVEYGSGPEDGRALLRSYPHAVIQIGFYMVGALSDTISGKYDSNLRRLARWCKNAHRSIYLRIGYEFDNPENHYDPLQYQEAFRYVVYFLRQQGVHNVAYVWHTQCGDGQDQRWMDWYPGDDYVDWFGVSLFGTQQIPEAQEFLKLAQDHGKPFMICEASPWGIYTTQGKIDYLNHVFDFIDHNNVEVFCYINSNWDVMPMYKGKHIGDARIEENPEIMSLWLNKIHQNRYLNGSDVF